MDKFLSWLQIGYEYKAKTCGYFEYKEVAYIISILFISLDGSDLRISIEEINKPSK